MNHVFTLMPSPVGELKLVANDEALVAILWENDNPNRVKLGALAATQGHPVLAEAERQLAEYFRGARREFSLKYHFHGTEFQREVWQALATIPFGETRSYAQIARQIGRAKAVRAVGAANGRNPISIVVPCHRVIGSGGSLTGFAGGLKAKSILLELESNRLL